MKHIKIETDETICELFFRLKEECELSIAKLYYVEKLYKTTQTSNIDGIMIEYLSYSSVNILFNEPEKYIPILEEITNRDNFIGWTNYKNWNKYTKDNKLYTDMTPFLSWANLDMNLEPIRR